MIILIFGLYLDYHQYMTELFEPINVWAFFKNGKMDPYLFFWKSRPIKINKVNLVHTSKIGVQLFYHFSVSSDSNFYRLKFDLSNMKWYLEAVEEGS